MVIGLPETEFRLQKRYDRLVVSHLSPNHRVAAGIRLPASLAEPFAATQAAWRFYANERVTLPQLAGPLIQCARQGVEQACDDWVLVALDWCNLHLTDHDAKKDRVELAQSRDMGYELLTALAISDGGEPLAPLCLEMRAANGVHSTRLERPFAAPSVLDGLAPVMKHIGGLGLGKPAVFIIDREADSVGHYRRWNAAGHLFLVRADDIPGVWHEGVQCSLGQVAEQLKRRPGAFADCGAVDYKGKPARQFVAETTVVLRRPARTHRVDPKTGKAKHKSIAGPPLQLRLVVSEVRDRRGRTLARWLLLSNLPATVGAATVALWYYWRWRIESYHKLLKGAGQQIECWQQETAGAFVRRLAVAAMAGVVVWRLAREKSPRAAEMRQVLVRLSGRQMKRGKNARPFTEPALLAGLGVLVPMLELLAHYEVRELRDLVQATLPDLLPPPPTKTRRPSRGSG